MGEAYTQTAIPPISKSVTANSSLSVIAIMRWLSENGFPRGTASPGHHRHSLLVAVVGATKASRCSSDNARNFAVTGVAPMKRAIKSAGIG